MRARSIQPASEIRDARTIEFRNFIDIPDQGISSGYTVDHYFFFPRNIGLDEDSWATTDFYRSSQVLLRLQAVEIGLHELADLSSRRNPGAVLLERAKLLLEPIPINGESLTAIAQLYGAEMSDAVKEEIRNVRASLKPGQVESAIRQLVQKTEAAVDALRVVQREMLSYALIAHRGVLPSLEFAEEYVSAILDERFAELVFDIRSDTRFADRGGEAMRAELILSRAIEKLNRRRIRAGYARPGGKSREYYAYRKALLKKELQKSLYVDTRATGKDPFVANSAAMVAAGLAATWATIAQVPLIAGRWTTWEGILLFAGAVGAYVLKDRIKDLVKQRLMKRWRKWDQENAIGDNIFKHVGLGEVRGRAYERGSWTDSKRLPREVMAIRQAERTVRGSSLDMEEVFHYSRRLEVDGTDLPTESSRFGIQAIVRFSLNDILLRLDDPNEPLFYFSESRHQFLHGDVPKVYHMNVVHVAEEDDTGRRWIHRSRIVVNRSGIVRVETIDDDEE